ncbi:MAG: photosystem I protein PsaX [Spirulinaceae cyanobacterium RM2_2_10]|nr:photosystem I protein PsaX [Spirulinaceae cyanobacterium SM2_1_0]NJO20031.1 photosystem I protein PsaX [Spirulinaceae cyanobacterium RM2_2_10]
MADSKQMPVPQSGTPPYSFRLFWGAVLLAGNVLVASFYFKIINP